MKNITNKNNKYKITSKDINYIKQTQTKSTLFSGRSSTNNNKRHSHQFNYQTQILKNLNKSTALCLNLTQLAPSTISHKVIHQNSHQIINTKKYSTSKYKQKDELNMNKTKQINNKNIIKSSKYNKPKSNSLQSSDIQKFHSHRQSLIINRQPINSYRINSEQKQNICSNLPQNINNNKKSFQNDKKFSLGKLNFILEKDFKQKSNLTKKKLLLSNECIIKENIHNKTTKQKLVLTMKKIQQQTKSRSQSIKQSKISIGSGRNHSIQKKKQNFSYLKTKDTLNNMSQNNMESTVSHIPLSQVLKQQKNVQKNYLRLKSPNKNVQNEVNYRDQKTYSIKSLLKALIQCNSDDRKQKIKQQQNIRKLIDCLTTADNQQHENEYKNSQKDINQNERDMKQRLLNKKITNFEYIQKDNQQLKGQNSYQNKQILSLNKESTDNKLNIENMQQLMIENQKASLIIKGYEMKIMSLYEQLIKQKQYRYHLQQIIQKYILQKQKHQLTHKKINKH